MTRKLSDYGGRLIETGGIATVEMRDPNDRSRHQYRRTSDGGLEHRILRGSGRAALDDGSPWVRYTDSELRVLRAMRGQWHPILDPLGLVDSAAETLGRKGGLAGRGASQVRGDSEHYRAIRAKRTVREYVLARYSERGGRDVRIGADDAVTVLVDGDGSQMTGGVDQTAGRIFAGWLPDLLREVGRVGLRPA